MSKSFAQKVMSSNNSNSILLECPHCGYSWNYGGSMERATCPSCSGKVKVEENAILEKDER